MVKLDLILFPFVLLLRVSLLVMSLSFSALMCIKHSFCTAVKSTEKPYNYFLHPFDNSSLRTELTNTTIWLWYVALSVLLSILYWTYRITRFGFGWLRFFWIAFTFWPKLYFHLFGPSSNGRSLLHIFVDPTNVGQPSQINIHRSNKAMTALLTAATSTTFNSDDPLCLQAPYECIALRMPKPPDCYGARLVAILLIFAVYSVPFSLGIFRLFYLRFFKRTIVPPPRRIRWRRKMRFRKPKRLRKHCKPKPTEPPTTDFDHVALASLNIDKDKLESNEKPPVTFDTDGIPFIIDNSATCILSNVRSLFIGPLKAESTSITTADGEVSKQRYIGIMRLKLTDDANVLYSYDIPGCIYDPNTPFNIIGLPFLQEYFGDEATGPDSMVEEDGTSIMSSGGRSLFTWDHGQHRRRFNHACSGLPELVLYQGTGYFAAFCTRLGNYYSDNVNFAFSSAYSLTPDAAIVSDTESDSESDSEDEAGDTWYSPTTSKPDCATHTHPKQQFELGMSLSYFDGKGKAEMVVYEGASPDGLSHTIRRQDRTKLVVHDSYLRLKLQPDLSNIPASPLEFRREVGRGITTEEAQELARPRILTPVQQELMDWHHRLYHLSFSKIFLLAELGHLPKRLLDCKSKLPLCVACQFGTAHRRPWRVKGKKSGSIRKADQVKPGDGVSIDQIVSAQPGLIPQMSGFLTSRRIWGVTTFCDHVSDFVYVHLMRDFTVEETILATKAFEKVLAEAKRSVKHYHADNGAFAHNGFLSSVKNNNQTITFCGVGAHHQNEIIENKNKMLTLAARTLLLHGIRMWPQMIDTMFWPFAIKASAERHNCLLVDRDNQTPASKLYDVPVQEIPVKTFHTLFCPIYVLDSRAQSAGGPGPPKWEPRSCIGVYLGHSPFHAGSVALVFNPTTG